MSEKKLIDNLLSLLKEKTKITIRQAFVWANKYENENVDNPKKEYNFRQIAAIVFLYESAKPELSWEIAEPLCNIDTAERCFLVPWLRDTFCFEKKEVYVMFKTWMKRGALLGNYIAYNMNNTYEIMQKAAFNGDNDLLEWLLSRNVEVDFRDSYRNTALHIAAQEGHMSTVKFLLEHGASIFVLNSERRRPFDLALDHQRFDICDILCPTIGNMITQSMIHDVVREGNLHKLQYLLRNTNLNDIWSALSLAVEKGYPQIVDKLLHHCPNLHLAPEEYNKEALTKAIVNGDRNIVEKLLAYGFQMEESIIDLAKEKNMDELLNRIDQTPLIDIVD